MIECHACNGEIQGNKFLLVPICHNHKIKYFCHDCCIKLLSSYLAEHVDEEFKVKTAQLSMLDTDTKTKDTFAILDEILSTLVEDYKLTWSEIFAVITMLHTKVLTLYIKDMHEYVAQKILNTSLSVYAPFSSSSTATAAATTKEDSNNDERNQPYQ